MILIASTLGLYSQNHMVEFVFAPEDNAIGFNISERVISDFGILIGAEFGTYDYSNYGVPVSNIDHNKYRLGISYTTLDLNTMVESSEPPLFLFYGALCYNKYDINLNDRGFVNIDKLDKYTIELGIKSTVYRNFIMGFNYDIIHRTGAFTAGVLF